MISLNTWRGRVFDELIKFIISESKNQDIFCFQEIFSSKVNILYKEVSRLNLLEELKFILQDFNCYFAPTHNGIYEGANFSYGNAIFVRKSLEIIDYNYFFTYGYFNSKLEGNTPEDSRNFQSIKLKIDNEIFTICNLHGVWIRGFGKGDNEERITQSNKIKSFLDKINEKIIICGDFNLNPDTNSIKILEKNLTNLIKIYDIKTTRSSYYSREDKFADYVFISSDIKVLNFHVLEDEVSDHLPLKISFK